MAEDVSHLLLESKIPAFMDLTGLASLAVPKRMVQ